MGIVMEKKVDGAQVLAALPFIAVSALKLKISMLTLHIPLL